MIKNQFLQSLKQRDPQVGLWVSLCSNYAADIVSSCGYDWVLLDMEHAPSEVATVLGQLQAMSAGQSSAVVRPMWNDPVLVKRLLDIGAQTLLFPMIQNAEEAELAVRATRYPPEGIRGVSGTTRANHFGRVTDYFSKVHDELCVLVQVETMEALGNIDSIAAVDGVDGIFFGPADLSADMGKLGQTTDEELWQVINEAAKKVKSLGKAAGTLVMDPKRTVELLNGDFTFVATGSDLGLLARSADKLLSDVKNGLTES